MLRKSLFVAIVLAARPSFLLAGDPTDDAAVFKPFLNEHTVAVVALDLSRLDLVALKSQYLDPLCRTSQERDRLTAATAQLQDWSNRLQADGVRQIYLLGTTVNMPQLGLERAVPALASSIPLLVIPGLKPDTLAEIESQIAARTKEIRQRSPTEPVLKSGQVHGATLIAFDKLFDRLVTLPTSPRPEFEAALTAAGALPLRAAIVPPPIFARAAKEILTKPVPGTSQPVGPVVAHGVRWVSAGCDLRPEHLKGRMVIQSTDGQAARALSELFECGVAVLGSSLMEKREYKGAAKAAVIGTLLPEVVGDRLVLELDAQRAAQTHTLAAAVWDLAMARTYHEDSIQNLKRIGLALLNYHSIHKTFPEPAIRDKDGKPLLSWRVAILPWLDESDLYGQFHLDEPWDSQHNRNLVERMPAVYRNPTTAATHPGRTRYLAPVGENLAFTHGQSHAVKEFTDGTSHTILVVEADVDRATIWTQPDDIEMDLNNPMAGLKNGSGMFLTLFADGSVRTLADSIDPIVLRALLTRNGGEAVDTSKY